MSAKPSSSSWTGSCSAPLRPHRFGERRSAGVRRYPQEIGNLVLITGATGYVGGRLLAALESRGEQVRCLSRRPEALEGRVAATTEVVRGDVLDPLTLPAALNGVGTVFYLVHSMSSGRGFGDADRRAAQAFGNAAREAGVAKIVYLGGLGRAPGLSDHLASRQEVGAILRSSGVPTIELRAAIVIGSGSASFEMIRALVEKLPAMITPRWVRVRTQPIAIEDVIAYLLACLAHEPDGGELYEIGGADTVTYLELMEEYGRQRGLRRLFLPVPFLTPRLSSLWLWLVTPVHAGVGKELVDSLRNETIVHDDSARSVFGVKPLSASAAILRALTQEDREFAEIRFAYETSGRRSFGGVRRGSRLVDSRTIVVSQQPDRAFRPIQVIGGRSGWYKANLLWRLRGNVDALLGGPGLRRGRRDPVAVRVGDAIDFWRVTAFDPDRRLRLDAEMKLPGAASLQFEVEPLPDATGSRITQTAVFHPAGLLGLAYWYVLWPFHSYIFGGMLRELARAAERA